jgi:arylsulfatase A-like enzyme
MNRFKLIRLCFTMTMLLVAYDAAAESRPNIVFIIADDLGWGDVGFHDGNAPTPHLDRMAREGLELTRHYVAPVCTPTRTGFMTGRCWSRFGATTPMNERVLPLDTVTVARALKQAGYVTCLTGKWHLGSLPEDAPNRFGFDHSFGSLAGGVSPWNHRYKKGPYSETWHRNGELIDQTGHVTDLITDEAIAWLEATDNTPFFLYVPFTAVHLPLKEPAEWLARVPDSIKGEVARHYAASTMHLDDSVGRILAKIDSLGKREQTLVVFTSDNGGSTAENNDLQYPDDDCPSGRLPGNNRPWRGKKGDVYEGGIRVPTIVSWPGKVPQGSADAPVQIIDWMPTFCALAGHHSEKDLAWDGIDLTALLTQHQSPPQRAIYTVGPSWKSKSLHLGDWKLILHGTDDASRTELYHLATDPAEQDNRATDESDRVKIMMGRMKEISAKDKRQVAR